MVSSSRSSSSVLSVESAWDSLSPLPHSHSLSNRKIIEHLKKKNAIWDRCQKPHRNPSSENFNHLPALSPARSSLWLKANMCYPGNTCSVLGAALCTSWIHAAPEDSRWLVGWPSLVKWKTVTVEGGRRSSKKEMHSQGDHFEESVLSSRLGSLML